MKQNLSYAICISLITVSSMFLRGICTEQLTGAKGKRKRILEWAGLALLSGLLSFVMHYFRTPIGVLKDIFLETSYIAGVNLIDGKERFNGLSFLWINQLTGYYNLTLLAVYLKFRWLEQSAVSLASLFALGQTLVILCMGGYAAFQKGKKWLDPHKGLKIILVVFCMSVILIYYLFLLTLYGKTMTDTRILQVCLCNMLLVYACVILSCVQDHLFPEVLNLVNTRKMASLQTRYETLLESKASELQNLKERCIGTARSARKDLEQGKQQEALATLSSLSREFTAQSPTRFCQVSAINALLSQKYSAFQKNDIEFSWSIVLNSCDPQAVMDLCIALGNLLDNAQKAVMDLEERERKIDLRLCRRNEALVITCTNPFLEKGIGRNSGTGYGQRILQELAKRYQGFFECAESNKGQYEATLLLVIPPASS